MTSDNDAAYQQRWDRDDLADRPDTDAAHVHHDRVRAHLAATQSTSDNRTAPARNRTEAQTLMALNTINHARQALTVAADHLMHGGPMRDGADPTVVAVVLHVAARRLALGPQWADRVRPPLGVRRAVKDEAA